MNDSELITTVRESFTDVHAATPVARIVDRGRALRTRRRLPGAAAALAVAAVLAVVATTFFTHTEGANPPAHPGVQLAAWTVVKQADGDIAVTIHQLHNPAGLQRTLRADGVPASVTFSSQRNPACQLDRVGMPVLRQVFLLRGRPPLVIRPAALPRGTGIALNPSFEVIGHTSGIALEFGLVYASPKCTGS